MLHILYLLFIAPLEFLMRLILEWGFSWTHSWGWSLVLLSFVVNTAILPVSNWAERQREKERELRRGMARREAMLRECFRGQERFALLSASRRVSGYDWRLSLRGVGGLLFQVPFFIAAYHLLSNWTPFAGRSFGLLRDLSAPDGLLTLGGVEVNVLPFVMTAANLFAAFVYARNLARRDRLQIYGIALLFLVLLYAAPSALVLYWTLNNVYSLGTNIVEKAWLRRRACQRVLKNGTIPLSHNIAEGTFQHFRGKLFAALRYSFGVGAVFWVCNSAIQLDRHRNLLDRDFRQFIWNLAVHYGTNAFLLGFIFMLVIKSHDHKRFLWNPLLMLIVSAIFFFLPSRNIATCLFYIFSLVCIQNYYNKISYVLKRIRQNIVFNISHSNDKENMVKENINMISTHSTIGDGIIAGLVSIVYGIYFCLYIPFCTYFYNANEFDFNGYELFKMVLPYFCITSLIIFLINFICTYHIPYETIKFPFTKYHSINGRINIVYVLFLTVSSFLWIEGAILSYGLPQLDGETNLFGSKIRIFIDSLIFIGCIIIGLRFWRIFAKHYSYFFGVFFLVMCASLIDAYIDRSEKIDIRTFKHSTFQSKYGTSTSDELKIVGKNTFYSNLSFGKSSNIIILLVDSLDTFAFEKTLHVYPELSKIFNGFWLFRENLGTGGLTHIAIPQILRGKIVSESNKELEFVRASLLSHDSIGADAANNGYNVFINSAFNRYIINKKDIIIANENNLSYNKLLLENFNMLYFRFLPYYAKKLLEQSITIKNTAKYQYADNDMDINKQEFNRYISKLDNIGNKSTFHFMYFFGTHLPFIKKDMIETTREFIIDFGNFVSQMNKHDIYNNSTIIIMADHGLGSTFHDHRGYFPERAGEYSTYVLPLLMVKTPDSFGDLIIRDDLMSSSYVRDMLNSFYKYGATNNALQAYLDNLPKIRYILYEGIKREAHGGFKDLRLSR